MIPVIVLTSGWLAGIFLQGWLNPPVLWWWLGAGGSLIFALIALWHNRQPGGARWPALLPLCLLAICLGALRLLWAAPSTGPDGLTYYTSEENVILVGEVSAEPSYSARTNSFRLSVQQIQLPGADQPVAVSGDVYVRTASSVNIQRGDLLQLTGKLAEPQEISGDDFPYRQWLSRQGIYVSMSYPHTHLIAHEHDFFIIRWFYSLNKAAQDIILKYVPDEESGVLISILLGDKTNLTDTIRNNFTDAGVVHVLVVSGSNIAILLMLVTLLLRRSLKRHTVSWVALGVIVFYVLLVGPSPPVLRAGIMGSMAVIGRLLGREYFALAGLFVSALLMTLIQPLALMDVSFQLSFMATLGLIVLAQPWQAKARHWPPFIQEGVILTVAAEVMLLPLLAFYFHKLSLVEVLTNTLIVAALALIMALGGLLVVTGGLFGNWIPLVGQVFGGLAWLFLAYLVEIVRFCAELPFSTLGVTSFHPIWIFLYYGLLGLAIWWWRSGRKSQLGQRMLQLAGSPLGLGTASLLTLSIWLAVWLV
jgi:competence protein ComEC